MGRGKIISFEGTDGTGKATQTKMLADHLTKEGIPFRQLSFPRYNEDSSMLVRMYLNGRFGARPDDVNPYAASTFYAADRYASFKEDWGEFYMNGGLIITDRYSASNAIHQTAKLPEEAWDAFIDWAFDFEHNLLGIPAPDRVIFLEVAPEMTIRMLRERESATNTHADIHERDTDFLVRSYLVAKTISAKDDHWTCIHCADGGKLMTPDQIHDKVWEVLAPTIMNAKRVAEGRW